MRIIFIHHSCFLVEIDDRILIFDYFDGNRVNGYKFTGRIPDYPQGTKIYMFASHSHQDHYDMDILRWQERYDMHYIFSKDIRISPNFLVKHGIDPSVREKVLFVKPDKSYELDGMNIRTLRSTDAGVAFYVGTGSVWLFHAGDLGDWRMEGAGDLINGRMRREYRHQIKKLEKKPINFAFIPMDPRLGEHQCDGLDFFLRTTDAEYVFPMHMWQDYSGIAAYRKRLTNHDMARRLIEVGRENQVFENF